MIAYELFEGIDAIHQLEFASRKREQFLERWDCYLAAEGMARPFVLRDHLRVVGNLVETGIDTFRRRVEQHTSVLAQVIQFPKRRVA